jgi:hypothetical protein
MRSDEREKHARQTSDPFLPLLSLTAGNLESRFLSFADLSNKRPFGMRHALFDAANRIFQFFTPITSSAISTSFIVVPSPPSMSCIVALPLVVFFAWMYYVP